MAAIRVRMKTTGQTGTLDEREFDPNVFEQIDAPSQGSPLTSLGSGAVNLLSGIFQAPARMGRGLATAIQSPFENIRLGQEDQTDALLQDVLTKRAQRTKSPQKLAQLSQQGQRISERATKQRTNLGRETQKGLEDVVKGTAGTAALLAPGGATGKQRLLSSVLSGAGSGFGASKAGEEVGATAGGALVGGATGLAGEFFRKFAGSLSKGKTPKIIKGSKLPNDPSFVESRDRLRKVGQLIGMSDNKTATQNSVLTQDFIESSQDDINSLLANQKAPLNQDKFLNSLKDKLIKSGYNQKSSTQNALVESLFSQVDEAIKDPVAFNQLKSELRGQLSNAFTATSKGTNPAKEDRLIKAFYDAIKDTLDEVSTEIRQINNIQKDVYDISDELAKTIKKDKNLQFRLPLGGNIPLPVSGEQARVARSGVGSLLGSILKAPVQAGGAVAEQPLLQNLLSSQAVQRLSQTPNAPQETPLSPMGDVSMEPVEQPQAGSLLESILTPDMLAMAVLSGDLNASEAKYLEALVGGGSSQDPEVDTALNVVDNLENLYGDLQGQGITAQSGGLGRIVGGIQGNLAALTQSSPGAATYKDTTEAFLSQLSRGLGERGVLTDEDINRIRKAIPGFSDSPDTAAQKWGQIRAILNGAVVPQSITIQ